MPPICMYECNAVCRPFCIGCCLVSLNGQCVYSLLFQLDNIRRLGSASIHAYWTSLHFQPLPPLPFVEWGMLFFEALLFKRGLQAGPSFVHCFQSSSKRMVRFLISLDFQQCIVTNADASSPVASFSLRIPHFSRFCVWLSIVADETSSCLYAH